MPKVRAAVVQRLRETKGWSQEELAKKAGIDAKTMSRMVNGMECNISTISLVAEALGTLPDRIIDDGTPDPPPSNNIAMSQDNRVHITLGLSLPFEVYNDVDKITPILLAIKKIANLSDGLDLDGVEKGSIKLSVSVSQEDYIRLMKAFEQHKLDQLKVTEATVPKESFRLLATAFVAAYTLFPVAVPTTYLVAPLAFLYFYWRMQKAGIEASLQSDGRIRLVRVSPADVSHDVADTLRQAPPDLASSLTALMTPDKRLPGVPFIVTLKLVPVEGSGDTALQLAGQLRELLVACPGLAGQVKFTGNGGQIDVAIENTDMLSEVTQVVVAHLVGKPVTITASIRKSEATPYAAFNYEASVTTRLDDENLEKVIKDIESRIPGTL